MKTKLFKQMKSTWLLSLIGLIILVISIFPLIIAGIAGRVEVYQISNWPVYQETYLYDSYADWAFALFGIFGATGVLSILLIYVSSILSIAIGNKIKKLNNRLQANPNELSQEEREMIHLINNNFVGPKASRYFITYGVVSLILPIIPQVNFYEKYAKLSSDKFVPNLGVSMHQENPYYDNSFNQFTFPQNHGFFKDTKSVDKVNDELTKLDNLKSQNLISQEEYDSMRKKVLDL